MWIGDGISAVAALLMLKDNTLVSVFARVAEVTRKLIDVYMSHIIDFWIHNCKKTCIDMEHARKNRKYRSARERSAYEILQQDRTTQDEMRCEQNCLIRTPRRCQMSQVYKLAIFTQIPWDFCSWNLGSFPWSQRISWFPYVPLMLLRTFKSDQKTSNKTQSKQTAAVRGWWAQRLIGAVGMLTAL